MVKNPAPFDPSEWVMRGPSVDPNERIVELNWYADPLVGARYDRVVDKIPPRARAAASSMLNHDYKITPAIRKLVAWYDADESSTSRIAVLAGPPGTGKTTAAAWIALNRFVEAEQDFRFVTATEIARVPRYGAERQALLSDAEADFIIDDLGAEHAAGSALENWRADFDELIDAIYRSICGQTIITTNLTAAQFKRRYGLRVVDRLAEIGEWIPVTGESMRRKRAEGHE